MEYLVDLVAVVAASGLGTSGAIGSPRKAAALSSGDVARLFPIAIHDLQSPSLRLLSIANRHVGSPRLRLLVGCHFGSPRLRLLVACHFGSPRLGVLAAWHVGSPRLRLRPTSCDRSPWLRNLAIHYVGSLRLRYCPIRQFEPPRLRCLPIWTSRAHYRPTIGPTSSSVLLVLLAAWPRVFVTAMHWFSHWARMSDKA